jgi:cell division septation protein DedD
MKLEINKQRLIGIAIIVVFLLIAIPFLLAGTTDSKDEAADSEMALKMPGTENVEGTATPASANEEDSLPPETTDAKDAEKPAALSGEETETTQDAKETTDDNASASTDENNLEKTAVTTSENTKTDASINETPSETTVATSAAEQKPAAKKTTTSTKAKPSKTKATTKSDKKAKTSATATDTKTKTKADGATENKYVWLVRVGYHVKPSASKDTLKKLNSLGFEKVHIKEMKINGKDMMNIFIGPLATEAKANEVAKKIEKKFAVKVDIIKISAESTKKKNATSSKG